MGPLGEELAVPPGDDVELAYSRQATSLVLQHLKDQQDQPNSDLLTELGWTPEELVRFLQRWEKLQREAESSPAARRELDGSLQSLGLRPPRDAARNNAAESDAQRGLRESGGSSSPPSKYADQYRAFKKGAAQGSQPR